MTRLGRIVVVLLAIGIAAFAAMVTVNVARRPSPDAARGPAVAAPLAVPVAGVPASALIDSWNDPRGDGDRRHQAIDIPAAAGTPVIAVADGRIERLFDSRLGGITIYQRSADGATIYYYAHLQRYVPMLAEGQAVRRGQDIAAVGSTGDASEATPHLHFEVHRMAPGERWWQGTGVDPYPLLRAAA